MASFVSRVIYLFVVIACIRQSCEMPLSLVKFCWRNCLLKCMRICNMCVCICVRTRMRICMYSAVCMCMYIMVWPPVCQSVIRQEYHPFLTLLFLMYRKCSF